MGPASFAYLLPRVDIACRPLAAAVGVIESFLFALDLVTCYLLVVAGKDRRAACLNAALAAVHGGTGTLWSIRRDSTAVDELRAGLCRASCGRMPIARAVLRRTARTCAGASVGAPAPAGVAVKPVGMCDDGGGADAAMTAQHILRRVETFRHADTRKAFTDCLGNLTLLTEGANRAAANKDLQKKKRDVYQRSAARLVAPLLVSVMAARVWDADAIATRQRRLVDLLM